MVIMTTVVRPILLLLGSTQQSTGKISAIVILPAMLASYQCYATFPFHPERGERERDREKERGREREREIEIERDTQNDECYVNYVQLNC